MYQVFIWPVKEVTQSLGGKVKVLFAINFKAMQRESSSQSSSAPVVFEMYSLNKATEGTVSTFQVITNLNVIFLQNCSCLW